MNITLNDDVLNLKKKEPEKFQENTQENFGFLRKRKSRKRSLREPMKLEVTTLVTRIMKIVFGCILGIGGIIGIFVAYFKWIHIGPYPSWMPLIGVGLLAKFGLNNKLYVEQISVVETNNAKNMVAAKTQYNKRMTAQMAQVTP